MTGMFDDFASEFRALAIAAGCDPSELDGPPRCFGGCGAEVARVAAECPACLQDRLQREHQAGIKTTLDELPLDLRWVELGNPRLAAYVPDATARRAVAALARDIDSPTAPVIVTFVGKPGAGKTLLATAYMRAFVRAGFSFACGYRAKLRALGARFVAANTLVRLQRETRLGDHSRVLHQALEAPVLVLDEVGHDADTQGLIFELVMDRVADRRVTIITTPHETRDAFFAATKDGGLTRRLFDHGLVIEVRKEAA